MTIFGWLGPFLHIVSFDVPYPANYGGVIDVYYKLYWLKKAGVRVHLHCFAYGRQPSVELESLCETVTYYRRRTGLLSNFSLLPYTVQSRRSQALRANLLADEHPILFEVLHTCYLMTDPAMRQRRKIYRHSNIEHMYYSGLAKSEKKPLKKLFLMVEAWKLKRFERILGKADLILAVNRKDRDYFVERFAPVRSVYLPSFHPHEGVNIRQGRGEYVLFHGNLGVSENYEAAEWLLTRVFNTLDCPVVIAGLQPPGFLEALCKAHTHVRLVANPDESEMAALIEQAQVHVLYTAQPTGLKLKLLNVLFRGRFVVCNNHLLSGTGLAANGSLLVARDAEDYPGLIRRCLGETFSHAHATEREEQVKRFNNQTNAETLIREIF